jgi:hypothetical protein
MADGARSLFATVAENASKGGECGNQAGESVSEQTKFDNGHGLFLDFRWP